MAYDLVGLWVGVFARIPAIAPKIGTRQPCFVDINNMVALAVDWEHLLGVQRTEDPVSLWVTLIRYSFDSTVCQAKLRLHQAYDFAWRHLHTTLSLDSLLNLLSTPDALVRVDSALNDAHYRCLLKYLTYLHLALLNEVCLLSLHIFGQIPYSLQL